MYHSNISSQLLSRRNKTMQGYALEEENEYYLVIQWVQWQSIDFSTKQIGLGSKLFEVKHFPLLLWCMLSFTGCEPGFALSLSLYQYSWCLWNLLLIGKQHVTLNLHITKVCYVYKGWYFKHSLVKMWNVTQVLRKAKINSNLRYNIEVSLGKQQISWRQQCMKAWNTLPCYTLQYLAISCIQSNCKRQSQDGPEKCSIM